MSATGRLDDASAPRVMTMCAIEHHATWKQIRDKCRRMELNDVAGNTRISEVHFCVSFCTGTSRDALCENENRRSEDYLTIITKENNKLN